MVQDELKVDENDNSIDLFLRLQVNVSMALAEPRAKLTAQFPISPPFTGTEKSPNKPN